MLICKASVKKFLESYRTLNRLLLRSLFLPYRIFSKENNKWYGVVIEVTEKRLGLNGDKIVDVLNVKCDPILIGPLRQQKGYYPAYHMNKESWISILLDDSVPLEEIKGLIDLSYNLTKKKIRSK